MTEADNQYPLGSDPTELERLDHQGMMLGPATRTLFEAAGIREGMRVLDLGCGAGDVAFVVAELVGESGEVLGIDRSADAVAKASIRARQRQLEGVHFMVGDIHEPAPGGPYDAIVTRLVLMYVPDPAAVLRAQAAVLRPGGVVAPIEFDITAGRSVPSTPSVQRAFSWVLDAFSRVGIHTALGPRLWTIARDAGLQPLGMLGLQPYFGPEDPNGAALLAGIVRTLVPLLERTGVTNAAEIGAETLHQRMSEELASAHAVFAFPTLVTAWSTRTK